MLGAKGIPINRTNEVRSRIDGCRIKGFSRHLPPSVFGQQPLPVSGSAVFTDDGGEGWERHLYCLVDPCQGRHLWAQDVKGRDDAPAGPVKAVGEDGE